VGSNLLGPDNQSAQGEGSVNTLATYLGGGNWDVNFAGSIHAYTSLTVTLVWEKNSPPTSPTNNGNCWSR
jgi:hypothetical protein